MLKLAWNSHYHDVITLEQFQRLALTMQVCMKYRLEYIYIDMQRCNSAITLKRMGIDHECSYHYYFVVDSMIYI